MHERVCDTRSDVVVIVVVESSLTSDPLRSGFGQNDHFWVILGGLDVKYR